MQVKRLAFRDILPGSVFRTFDKDGEYWVKASTRTAILHHANGNKRAGPFYVQQQETFYTEVHI